VSDDHVTITGGANQCAVFATQPLTASGGANYVWNTGEVGAAIQTTVSYSIYTVTATKCDGTTMTASITVVTNTALNIVGDGCISAQPNGATTLTADAPNAATISYAYLWSTGETTPQITAIAAGDYSVTVTDALNGCTAASSRAIGQTPTIQSLTATSSFISAGQTVTLTTTILPTTYPLYRWSTPGTYTVTVSNGTDALCSATASITITAPPSCVSPTNQLILGSNTPYPTIRDAITAQVIPAGTMTGGNIGIDGDLAINDNYYFDGVEINIGGGGSITVEKTVTFLSTNLAGLGCLWQGIDVQPNGKLIMKGCSISDAYRAVTATKGAVSLQNNSFDRNYVGLYSSNFFVLTYFSGNVFDCTGVLANPYPGITVGNWAYAGVELHDADYVNLALTANNLHINTFQNLNCGIVAEGATYLNVLWARFKNITKHYTNAHDGAGIAALHDADIYHEGRSVFENPTTFSEYDNCDFGIYADNAQAVSRYNTFSDCGVSVYAQNATADNAISVQWGRIQNRNKGNYGVWCQMCDNAEAVEVDGNIIQLSNTLTGVVAAIAYNGAGIANNASFNHAITNNDIRQGNAPDGIRILNHSNVLVSGNAVNIRNTSCRNGINIESANNAYVKCNTVTGNGSTQNNNADPYEPIGIRVVASTGGRYHSNYTGDLWTGAYFNIDCSTTDLKQNIFATSHTGLNMGSTLVMNSQDNKGNLWIGNQFTNSAKHDGLAQSGVLQGRIKTNTANNGAFTILGEYWAANAATVSQPNAPLADWFVSSTDTQAHDDDCVVFQSAIPPIVIGDNDILIAEGDLRIADYPEEMKKWTTLTFYEKLKEHPELVLPYSVLAHFRDSIETTVFDDLYANFKARTTTVKMQPALKTSLTAKRLTIKSILDGLRLTDSLFVADSTHIDTTILAQRKAQMTALKTVKTDYKTSKNDYYTLREARSTAAKAENTFLVPTELHAYNEKSVNEIYFTTVAKGNLNYTESQKIILANIAQQCPIIGGRSVYTARAMYASVANIPYNDITTCAFQNVNFRTQQPQKPTVKTSTPDIISVKVFPNPANNLVTLQVNKALEENATVVLTDILGRVVYNTVLVQGSIMLPITVSDWAEGIYTYRVILNNNAISLGKLTIIK
jgi:hypothetical protein